jgi:G3E family GTPase
VRLVSVSGTLGSGKTTLVGRLVANLSAAGGRCAAVVNEQGKASYDDLAEVRRGEVPVEYLRGG